MKRIIVMTLALSLSVVSLASAQEAAAKAAASETVAAKAPRLTIVEPVKDYETVAKGEKLVWAFVVKNTGDADLQILAARPACGCTVAEFDKVIKPGETGKVSATVDTTTFSGPIAKGITLETNDPSTPAAQLTIKAIVKPFVEAFPAGYVRFSNMLQGDTATQSVILYSEESEPFEITRIETPADWIKATFEKITDPAQRAQGVGASDQNQYKVNITITGADVKTGPLAERVHVFTNSKHQAEYPITVTGAVRPQFRVDPYGVNFGEVTPSDPAATRSVIVKTYNIKDPASFTVTKAESSIPWVVTSVKPTATQGEYEVTLALAKTAKPGPLDGKLTIYTNNKVRPVETIPLSGVVKGAAKAAPKAAATKSK